MPPARWSPRFTWRRSATTTEGFEIILIGHKGHPEVIGTMGQLPDGAVTLIETVEDAEALQVKDPAKLAYVTQTTLSVDDTKDVIAALQRRFPAIKGPYKEDICYATTNRQEAVKAIAAADRTAARGGCAQFVQLEAPRRSGRAATARRASMLVQRASELDWAHAPGPLHHRHHAPAPRRPSFWSTRSSMPSARITT